MFEIMIVDDESKALQYLRNITDFESHGFKIVCEARSGQDGIVKYRQYKPDLVIADIVMPVMSGLDMADEILKINPDCLFILLTAYNDFNYAQKAIKLEVKSYILKHELDETVMTRELSRISNIIRERRRREEFMKWESFEELFNMADSVAPSDFGRAAESRLEKWRLPFECGRSFVYAFRFDPVADTDRLWDNEDEYKAVVSSIYNRNGVSCELLTYKPEKALFLVVLPAGSSHARRDSLILASCTDLLGFIKKRLSIGAYVGVSSAMMNGSELKKAYSDASEAAKVRFFKKQNELFFYERLRITDSGFSAKRDSLIATFSDALAKHLYDNAAEAIKSLFLDIHVIMSDMEKYETDVELILEALHKIQDLNIGKFYKTISDCKYIEEVYYEFRKLFDNLIKAEFNKYSPKTNLILQYIDKNLSKNLTLNDIAEHVGINSVYVCQILKKEVGVSFKTYLNEKRISKAEELLKSQKYKTYEIAEMLGYQSVQHFCSTFKKKTGRSPGHFY